MNVRVTMIQIVIGSLGTVPKSSERRLNELEIGWRIEIILTRSLLRSARILRRVLETWGDLLSLRLQWKTISERWWVKKKKLAKSKTIIMLRCQHISPWPSLATRLYRPSFLGGLLGYILYRHRAVVYRFQLVVLPLLVHVKGSTGIYRLWVRPYFSSSVLYVWLSNLDSFHDGW